MKLPTVELRPSRGARPSAATPRPTDLGLGEVSRSLESWAGEVEQTRQLEEEVARAEAEETVRPILERYETEADAEFNEAGAAWDGVEPGFARRATGRLAERRRGYGEELPLTSTERDALERGLNRHAEGLSQKAIQYESQRRGALAVEAATAREGAVIGRLTGDYLSALGEKQAEIDASFDGSTDDYEARLLAEHDLVADRLIAEAPEHLRPRVTQQMGQQRLQLQARAMDVQQRGTAAYVAAQVRQGGDATLNALIAAPSMYEQAVANVETLVAPLPAAARGAERSRLLDGYTDAYVGGLIRDGQHDQAIALLEGGTLDTRLQPDTKARLLDHAVRRRDEPDVGDVIARLQADQLMRDNLASIAATGQGIAGADPGSIGGVLGVEGAARYTMEIEAARRMHASLPGFDGMSEAEIAGHVASLAPEPGTPGFAEAQRTYELAQQQAAREIKAREEDPAARALAVAPGLREGLAGLGSGDVEARRRAAATYAAGQMAVQEDWGVAPAARRVLSKEAAADIVARAEGDADPANGLRGLGAVLEAFQPPLGVTSAQMRDALANRNRVIAELKAAGADPGDIAAAIDLNGDPVRLGRYVSATRGAAYERLEGRDKTDLNAAVDRAMVPYLRSFEAAPGSADLTAGRRVMAQRLAAERVAAGDSESEAAQAAIEVLAAPYRFVGPQGWRVPRTVAEGRTSGVRNDRLVQQGTARMMAALSLNDGQGFYTPGDDRWGQTAEQRKTRYVDYVRNNARWFTTPDDAGLVLMHRNLDGGYSAVLNSEGRPVAYRWSNLVSAGSQPGPDGRVTLGQRFGGARQQTNQPRGIRNNNPGNIEYRAANPWRGQTGHDGRFARFATPEAGIRALAIDLGTKHRRGLNTVRKIISTYAPPSDNNTAAYIAAIARVLRVGPDDPVDLNDPGTRAAFMGGIITHENGSSPYDPAMLGRIAVQVTRERR